MAQRLHLHDSEPNAVLITGPVAFDLIITPTHHGDKMLGGSAAFAAIAASYFAPPSIVGVVGDDFDDSYFQRFKDHGIDVSCLEKVKGETFTWVGRYFEDFNRRETIKIELGVFKDFKPKLSDKVASTPYVFLGNIDPTLQLDMLDALKGNPFVIVDTIDHWIKLKREELLKVLDRTNILMINDAEACSLAQVGSIIQAGHKLREMGIDIVIIKKGEHGALLFHNDGIFSMPSYPVVQLRDPTGAGDSFAGAIAGYLAAVGKHDFFNLKHALVYATAIASLTVEGFSCDQLEAAGPKVIEERYEALINMMTF